MNSKAKKTIRVGLGTYLACWIVTATLGIAHVEKRIVRDYTSNPFLLRHLEESNAPDWTDLKKNEKAELPNYYMESWSPVPFVIFTDAGFHFGFTGGEGFDTTNVWFLIFSATLSKETTWVS